MGPKRRTTKKERDILQSKNRSPFTVARDTLLSPCVIHMADEDLGSLVVMDGSGVAELLTFREVMNPTPLCTTPDVELHELLRMEILREGKAVRLRIGALRASARPEKSTRSRAPCLAGTPPYHHQAKGKHRKRSTA